jgi:hypothetical protein
MSVPEGASVGDPTAHVYGGRGYRYDCEHNNKRRHERKSREIEDLPLRHRPKGSSKRSSGRRQHQSSSEQVVEEAWARFWARRSLQQELSSARFYFLASLGMAPLIKRSPGDGVTGPTW